MRFKSQQRQNSRTPQINLVPMLDVMMIILTYFIVAPRVLTKETPAKQPPPTAGKNAGQPDKAPPAAEPLVNPIVIELNGQGQLLLGNQPITEAQIVQQVQDYIAKNPKGGFVLKADPRLPYSQITRTLAIVRSAGGNRISLSY